MVAFIIVPTWLEAMVRMGWWLAMILEIFSSLKDSMIWCKWALNVNWLKMETQSELLDVKWARLEVKCWIVEALCAADLPSQVTWGNLPRNLLVTKPNRYFSMGDFWSPKPFSASLESCFLGCVLDTRCMTCLSGCFCHQSKHSSAAQQVLVLLCACIRVAYQKVCRMPFCVLFCLLLFFPSFPAAERSALALLVSSFVMTSMSF